MNTRIAILATLVTATLASQNAQASELIVNGGFEASSSNFTTPPGWTNVGHEDGVLQYATSAPNITPYQGLNFYSLDGAGDNGVFIANDGITQWGPRYFLAIIPVTLIALFLAPKPRWLPPLILLAALPSFYQNTHGGGIKELRWRYNHRLTTIYQLLNRKPGNVVIASPHFLSYDFGYLFDRNYFFGASGDDSLRRLLPLLKSNGVHEIICLYNPRFHTLPPMLDDSTTHHRFDTEAATAGWIKEDVDYKIVNLDTIINQLAVKE